jgi:cold shock CspA family protein
MQASVHTFEPDSGTGSVLCDDGTVLAFGAQAWAGSGLRHLRPGQRVNIGLATATKESEAQRATTPADDIARLWVTGIGEGQVIE